MNIRDIVEGSDAGSRRWFDKSVFFLIIASLVAMSLSTLHQLPPAWKAALAVCEIVIVVLFTIEYALRIIAAENKWSFIRSFYGVVDLVAILPFYLSLLSVGIDLRAVRGLRLLRVFRLFEIARYSTAVTRLMNAVKYARNEALVFLFATLVLLYIAALGIHHFEHEAQPEKFESVFHSLWWAVVTLTTVGYGDAYPVTVGGRIFTFIILLCGMGIVAVPAGLVATGMTRAAEEDDRASADRAARPRKLSLRAAMVSSRRLFAGGYGLWCSGRQGVLGSTIRGTTDRNETGCETQTLTGRPRLFAGSKRICMATMPAASSSAS